jgi:hypothetical protein
MSQLFTLPFIPALSLQGDFMASATLTFSLSGTTTAATVYADAALSVPLGSVVAADAYGRFPSIYLDNAVLYRCVLKNAQGVQIGAQVDPCGLNYGGETGASQIGTSNGDTVQEALDKKANLDSPALVNLPTAPTADLGDSSQQIATTAFVASAVAAFLSWTKTGTSGHIKLGDLIINFGRAIVADSTGIVAVTFDEPFTTEFLFFGASNVTSAVPSSWAGCSDPTLTGMNVGQSVAPSGGGAGIPASIGTAANWFCVGI